MSVEFDNSNSVISGENSADITRTSVGARIIIHPRIAFRTYYNIQQDVGFTVNAANEAEIFEETVNYVSLWYDQIVFLGSSYIAGFRLGYEVPASGDQLSDRSATTGVAFFNYGMLLLDYSVTNIKKFSDDLTYEETDSRFNVGFGLSF